MLATTSPRFLKLPIKLQIDIWTHAAYAEREHDWDERFLWLLHAELEKSTPLDQ